MPCSCWALLELNFPTIYAEVVQLYIPEVKQGDFATNPSTFCHCKYFESQVLFESMAVIRNRYSGVPFNLSFLKAGKTVM